MQRTLTSLFTRSLVQRSAVPSTGASFTLARQLHAGSKLANEFADSGNRGARRGPPERLPNGVFVGGLAHEMGEEDLKRVFGQIGEVKAANVVFDRDTQRSKRFGFVYFADAEPVNTVISDPSLISELGPTTGVSKLEDGPRKRSNSNPTLQNRGGAEASNSIFIAGFSPTMTKSDIESAVSQFYPESGIIDEVVLPLNRIERMEEEEFSEQDEPRRNKGFAFVKFSSNEDAKKFLDKFTKAIEQDGFTFPGNRTSPTVNFANPKKERSEYESGRGQFSSGGRGGFGGDRRGGGRSFGGRDQGRGDRRGGGGGARDWINEDRGRFQSRGDDY